MRALLSLSFLAAAISTGAPAPPLVQPSAASQIEARDGPAVKSAAQDVLTAWRACVSAVDLGNHTVDEAALRADGWSEASIVDRGRIIHSLSHRFFIRRGVEALITMDGPDCVVEGLMRSPKETSLIEPEIKDQMRSRSARKRVPFGTRSTGGADFYVAGYFTVAVYLKPADPFVQVLSHFRLDGMQPIRIHTVDASGSTK